MKCVVDKLDKKVMRICDDNAADLVGTYGGWEYCSKAYWKKNRNPKMDKTEQKRMKKEEKVRVKRKKKNTAMHTQKIKCHQ
jgi:hypothetical protein